MDEGDVMVNSDDRDATLQDRTEVAPVHLETSSRRNDAASVNSELSDTPEYATITSRLRQHDPPSYHSYTGGSSSCRTEDKDEETEKDDHRPEDDASVIRSRDEEDKIEVLDPLLEEPKERGANGYPPGAGWAIVATSALPTGSFGSDEHLDSTKAERNSKILEQFEDKHKDKDECFVDCLYYTTTCCECTIL